MDDCDVPSDNICRGSCHLASSYMHGAQTHEERSVFPLEAAGALIDSAFLESHDCGSNTKCEPSYSSDILSDTGHASSILVARKLWADEQDRQISADRPAAVCKLHKPESLAVSAECGAIDTNANTSLHACTKVVSCYKDHEAVSKKDECLSKYQELDILRIDSMQTVETTRCAERHVDSGQQLEEVCCILAALFWVSCEVSCGFWRDLNFFTE